MNRYRASNGEDGPVVVCEDDEPGTVMAMTGRQQDAEEIAAALNSFQGAVDLGDAMASAIERRWTGPNDCSCEVCKAAKAWRRRGEVE